MNMLNPFLDSTSDDELLTASRNEQYAICELMISPLSAVMEPIYFTKYRNTWDNM